VQAAEAVDLLLVFAADFLLFAYRGFFLAGELVELVSVVEGKGGFDGEESTIRRDSMFVFLHFVEVRIGVVHEFGPYSMR